MCGMCADVGMAAVMDANDRNSDGQHTSLLHKTALNRCSLHADAHTFSRVVREEEEERWWW